MVAVVLPVAGDEIGVQVGVRSRRRATMRLEVDRADERELATDLAELLHPPERLALLDAHTRSVDQLRLLRRVAIRSRMRAVCSAARTRARSTGSGTASRPASARRRASPA